ncbi:Nif11-like leader peptide family natural product precursor [Coleofasciculus sp.]|uniref:Nif11-like leader peptide family natural product precursor n=1 Tax=Coleofasciculus sp. TaxID=3100458 RepID=UPI0039F93252
MSQLNIQSFKALDVSAEELRLQKAQQVIDELFMAANSDEKLKKQLEAAISPESLVEIAASQGYELTVADLEMLHDYDQKAEQSNSDELDDDELSEQELELVAGGGASGFAAPPPVPVPNGFNPHPKPQGSPVPWSPW